MTAQHEIEARPASPRSAISTRGGGSTAVIVLRQGRPEGLGYSRIAALHGGSAGLQAYPLLAGGI
jgi:hypothetical protein